MKQLSRKARLNYVDQQTLNNKAQVDVETSKYGKKRTEACLEAMSHIFIKMPREEWKVVLTFEPYLCGWRNEWLYGWL
ncbi:Malformin synthetase mlfA [Frankliniella fusca]|uniref:Malformin synthetase mlfA n=1 Tax=Frankliniella fusca TaxID=407009 RepID=A0AAE1HAZ9_9NEOP|nr:Malformin synthetase mlfA [Frankliniella fusca]